MFRKLPLALTALTLCLAPACDKKEEPKKEADKADAKKDDGKDAKADGADA